jgi:hypothetical protein
MPGENVYKLVDQSFLHISLWLLFVGSWIFSSTIQRNGRAFVPMS